MTISGFLSSALFTWGIATLLFKLYDVTSSPMTVVMISLSILFALFLIFYNAATTVVFFSSVGAALAAFLFVLIRERLEIGEAVVGFVLEAFAFFTFEGGAAYYESHSLLVTVVFCLIPALPSLFLFGRFRGAFVLGVAAGALFVTEFWYGVVDFYPELCAVACSITAVSAGCFARNRQAEIRSARSGGSIVPSDKRRVTGVQAGGRIAAAVLSLSLPVLMVISLLLPPDAYGLQNVAFETLVDDVVDITGISAGYGRGRTTFRLSDYGYNSRLGGPVFLSIDPVFSITASAPVLLRASTKDIYTGSSWERTPDAGEYRFDSGFAVSERAKAFGEGLPAGASPDARDSRFSGNSSLVVTLLGPAWRSELLTSGRPLSMATENIDPFIPYFDALGDLFSKRYIVQGHCYTVYEERLDFTGRTFAAAVMEYEDLVNADKEAGLEPDPYYEEIVARYTALPEGLDQVIYDFTRAAAGESESPYRKILAIRDVIARRSVYTLYPPEVPQSQEFVAWFLRTGIGYCTYYATALTVMARTVGVPARYVEGFSTFGLTPEEDGSFLVTGQQAHAWCEIYLEGIGWIPVDATIDYAMADAGQAQEITVAPDTGRTAIDPEDLWEEYMDDYGGVYDFGDAGAAPWKMPEGVFRAFIALLIMSPVFALYMAIQFMRRPLDLTWIQKRMGPEDVLIRYWRDILKMLPYFGVEPTVGETPGRLASRMGMLQDRSGGIILFGSIEFMEIAGMVEDCVYGSVTPEAAALHKINIICQALDGALMKRLLPFRYLFEIRKWRRDKMEGVRL